MKKENITVNGIEFKYNEKEQAYGKIIKVEEKDVLVVIYDSYVGDNVEKALQYAVKYINELNIEELKNIIVKECYEKDKDGELKNITLEQFNSSTSLLSISVDNNYVEYWFDDNDIYGGHNIVISKKHEDNEYNVNLAG